MDRIIVVELVAKFVAKLGKQAVRDECRRCCVDAGFALFLLEWLRLGGTMSYLTARESDGNNAELVTFGEEFWLNH